jgi:hypothetical protein
MKKNLRSLLPMVLFLCMGCPRTGVDVGTVETGDAAAGTPATGAETDFTVLVTPERELDILFMVDNSPSMDPKQKALAANFPAMIQELQNLPGGMPDIHIGVISSDFGAGGGELGANCGIPLGNRGLLWGNDNSTAAMAGISEVGYNQFATVANIANGCGLDQGARWISDIQNAVGAGRVKNYTGNLIDVFSCLAKAVGTKGCGEEHQLQSIRIALNPQTGYNDANIGFLRPKAYLAIVMVTDEDDCSADPYSATDKKPNNDGIFTPNGLYNETTNLRCAGRGHVCNGKAIPNYDPTNGYGSQGPLSLNFADCAAKDPTTADPQAQDYHQLPLIPIQTIIDDVVRVKNGNMEKIFVSGIIGWPQSGDLTGVKYRIDRDATSLPPSLQSLWDYMPICTLPDQKSSDGNIYKAYGGLRLKKFIDGFGESGKTFSICNNDFVDALSQIGKALVVRLRPGCVPIPLADSDPNMEGVQPDCQVQDRIPCDKPGENKCFQNGYEQQTLLQCKDATGLPLNPDSPQLNSISEANRPCWYLSYDTSEYGCAGAFQGQEISVLRKSGTVAPPGTLVAMRCLSQPSPAGSPPLITTTRKKLGATCQVGADYTSNLAVYNSTTSECASDLCLKPMGEGGMSVDTSPYCSATCSTDSDCKGVKRDPKNPNDKTCQTGYSCGQPFVTGPLCCKKLCICNDFLAFPPMLPLICDPTEHNGATGCN